jgi:hypothetical protein
MALSAGVALARRGPPNQGTEFGYPVAPGEQIWRGGVVGVNASGQLQRIQTSGTVAGFGVASKDYSNVGNASASTVSVVAMKGCWALTVPSATTANIGAAVYASDDNTLTLTAGSLHQVGILAGIEGGQTYVQMIGS